LRVALAWGVHFYTALGLVCAAGIAVLIVQGGGEAFRGAFILMLIATLIDATDGTLARAVRIKETLPGFDGRRLDDLVDFLNYTFLPLFLIRQAGILPAGMDYWLLLPLMASAYGFCQVSAKTDDGYFLGFPSYWNLVAFYLYVLQPLPGWAALVLVIVPALLTFVPSRYLYPTQPGKLNRATSLLGGVWAGLLVWIVVVLPPTIPTFAEPVEDWPRSLAVISLFFPVYYMVASWAVTLKLWRVRRRKRREELRTALSAK
jgi:phosphatidylcholine synthase